MLARFSLLPRVRGEIATVPELLYRRSLARTWACRAMVVKGRSPCRPLAAKNLESAAPAEVQGWFAAKARAAA